MADVKWIKMTTDMFDNRKIKFLRKLPDGNNIVLIWVMLLTLAGRCNSNGMIFLTENIPYTTKMLADELDFEESTVILAIQSLEQLNMVRTDDDGFFIISGWDEYQNTDRLSEIREYNRIAKQKQRAKQKESKSVLDMSLTCQPCQGTEVDKEKDIKNKNYISSCSNIYSDDDNTKKSEECGKKCGKLEVMHGKLGKGVVYLTDEQMTDLLERIGIDAFDRYIEKLADFIIDKNANVKNHYETILKWYREDTAVYTDTG